MKESLPRLDEDRLPEFWALGVDRAYKHLLNIEPRALFRLEAFYVAQRRVSLFLFDREANRFGDMYVYAMYASFIVMLL